MKRLIDEKNLSQKDGMCSFNESMPSVGIFLV